MRRSPIPTARRTVRRAATWRPKRAGAEPIDIAWLISPLRYDVAIRAQFFEFAAARPDQDPAAWLPALREHPYRVWFEKVAMARFRPWVLRDPALLERQFAERVATAAALWRSYRATGFDQRYPVTLRGTSGPRVSDSGATLDRAVHVGDGGHRLAMLLADGASLAPWMYRVDPRPMPLIDNTAVLTDALAVDPAVYAAFLAPGYGEEADDIAVLRERVAARRPGRLAELDSVLRAHHRTPPEAAS
ncbi:MAG TPA: hypothetical protein VFI30_00325 [Nocardioidaceae bacterium]|nr:hypothetical protein [Nocardioidaceae bacterium]